jgi:toxin-antitoxin system, antitoxin component, xre family
MLFGEKLKSLREKNHLTQTDVAKTLGVTQRAISYYETNNVVPNDPEALNKLAKIFDVTLDELLLKNEGSKSQIHALVEKLIADTNDRHLTWETFDWEKFDDCFSLQDLPQYKTYKFAGAESYFVGYSQGGYLIAKLISPNQDVEIALFVFLNNKFLYIANNTSIKQIDELYILLTNSASGVNLFIEQYLDDDLSRPCPNIFSKDDIPF